VDEGWYDHHPSVAGPIRDLPGRRPALSPRILPVKTRPVGVDALRQVRRVLTANDPAGQAILIDLCGGVGAGLATCLW